MVGLAGCVETGPGDRYGWD